LLENERNDMQQKIRLMLVEDEAIVNEAICALLEMEESIAVVGKAATAATAVQQAHLLKPDVLLLDLHLPDRPGVEVIVELMGDNPALRILILTAYAADDEVVAAFRAGAVGYILKTQAITELVRAIEQATQGQSVLPPAVAHIMLRQLNRLTEPTGRPALSGVERRVLVLVAQGLTNKEIARHLELSPMTVHAHVSAILSKLNVTNRTQAALFALKQGWVSLEVRPKPDRQAILPLLRHHSRDRLQSPSSPA
jgi:DNA-binding NarL/FixJ family response regulator